MVLKQSVSVNGLSVDYLEFARSMVKPMGALRKTVGVRDVDFDVEDGDVVALIGRNGAGKSTLLKAIAGLLRPSKGNIRTKGRVLLLAGADPGFAHDTTGRKNIEELAYAYGVPMEEIPRFIESIIDFASIGEAIDRNVRGYSSGMRGKLGFGFMTGLRPDLLLIDETLAVGDAEFRNRAMDRLREFVEGSGSVIISTHSLGLAREICNRGILLDSGSIVADSSIEDALESYRKLIKV